MSIDLRLILFDVDGTLVDSQADIVASMAAAFEHAELPVPDRANILATVGLSLPRAMAVLAPSAEPYMHDAMVDAYKAKYMALRAATGSQNSSPLFPGIREVLDQLNCVPVHILGVATGKSRRGLDALIEGHALDRMFLTQQCADHHPSKPHPSMVLRAMSEIGVSLEQTVVIGDTSYDMEMARAAGAFAIGVSWGYHPRDRLSEAHMIVDQVDAMPAALDEIWRRAA